MKTFPKRTASLDCLDAAVLNAGIATEIYEILEDNESTITVARVALTADTLIFREEVGV